MPGHRLAVGRAGYSNGHVLLRRSRPRRWGRHRRDRHRRVASRTAVFLIEPPGWRRRVIAAFIGLGAIVSFGLLLAMIRGPVTVQLESFHVSHGTGVSAAAPLVAAYLVATCGSFLFAGNRVLAWFGVVNVVAIVFIAVFALRGFASLWCAWAAVTSAAFALWLRLTAQPSLRAAVTPS
jgi:hypothetical protein